MQISSSSISTCGIFAAAILAVSLSTGPAAACRVGGDDLLVVEMLRPPPETPRHSSILLVELDGHDRRGDLEAARTVRGFRVGSVRVLKVERGPKPPPAVPVYLEVLTSCSNFGRSPHRFTGRGYIVGQLKSDAEGVYIVVAERNDATGDWN